ncbi:NAD(P)-dependent oxidoreductase [Sulfitobacter sp. W074]|uniref:NAD(P)-dependent oxidoreductase n=1 Tax=Sulfitobacter sp. W074 TaxID=2867026 RepID=UPI0021A5EA3E|nr:NAD(P)-dependent oxidoreductase [Sulfitobacter sp. W074]UWR38467.1 NAD(P)-dependent oxidoreductase [Sulfitobacter sp. W074]
MTAEKSDLPKITFLGLGQMGLPMAANLVSAGYRVQGCDLSEAARLQGSKAGILTSATPVEVASQTDIIITILPNGGIVREALLGADGALAGNAQPSLVIDMSSSAPTETIALGDDLVARGIVLMDAPVSGGRKRAIDGSLTIMAGGADAVITQAEPALLAMGERVFRCGGLGAGHAMKAINNYVSGAGAVAAMEAVVLGRSFGLDPEKMVDILNVSTGRNNTTEAKLRQFILSESYASGFGLGLMAKDIGIAAELAEAQGVKLPTLRAMAALWRDAADVLKEGSDHTEMFRYLVRAQSKKNESNLTDCLIIC